MLPCRAHGTLATTATGLPVVSSIATAEFDFTYYAQPSERNGEQPSPWNELRASDVGLQGLESLGCSRSLRSDVRGPEEKVTSSQYRGTVGSTVSDQASMPPARLSTRPKSRWERKLTTLALRIP